MNETMAARMIRFLYLRLWLDQCVSLAEDLASLGKAAYQAGDVASYETALVLLAELRQRAKAYGAALSAEWNTVQLSVLG